jgi:hypothetical protein
MTKQRKPSLRIEHQPRGHLPWVIIERSEHGDSTLVGYATFKEAQAVLDSLRKSAVPRLSLLFPFGR